MECMKVKYQNKIENAYAVLYTLGIDPHHFQTLLKCELTAQMAFDFLISLSKEDREILDSDLPAKKIIRNYYSSLNEFCIRHKLKYKAFCRLLNQNRNLSFMELLPKYLVCDEDYNYTFKHVYCGVSMEAICIKFQINYDLFSRFFDPSKPFEEQLLLFYLRYMNIPQEIKEEIISKLSMILNCKKVETSLFFPSEKIYTFALYQCYELLDACNAYYIAHYFENEWLESYYKWLENFKKLYPNKSVPYHIKGVYRKRLLEHYLYSKKELEELKNEFYSDYTLVDDVWIYKRTKIK